MGIAPDGFTKDAGLESGLPAADYFAV